MLIPVTTYVKRYLSHEYGPGPYNLDNLKANRSRLRLSFLSTHFFAVLYPSLYTHEKVSLNIARSPTLVKYYDQHKEVFSRGCFFADDFFNAFYLQVKTLHDYADMTYENAIITFMKKYNISEEDYSLDISQRQINKMNRRRREFQDFEYFNKNQIYACKIRPHYA